MYTSDISQKRIVNHGLAYLGFTVFLALFGAVYEKFSHEVYSYYMIYAFSIPLLLGVTPAMGLLRWKKYFPDGIGLSLWDFGVITLSVGSIFQGVLDIYGTTNELIYVYPIAGAVLMITGLFLLLSSHIRRSCDTEN